MIDGNKLVRHEPIFRGEDLAGYKVQIVITKEEFLECYNAWVKGGEKNE